VEVISLIPHFPDIKSPFKPKLTNYILKSCIVLVAMIVEVSDVFLHEKYCSYIVLEFVYGFDQIFQEKTKKNYSYPAP